MSDWNIPKEYLDQSKEIERLKARVDELEAALPVAHIIGLTAARQRRANSEVDTTSVDGYCGKRSSKAGLQAGETEHE